MDEQQISSEAIMRAEIAIAIMNTARGLLSERVATIEVEDPDAAEKMREKRRALLAVQNRIRAGDGTQVEGVIREWGPRVRDAGVFWREL
ncbi:hypothetical protein [Brucella intermedia]|uniref:hypothetical protein n=1 Tax=Brucella intermedia TaxID=94625 RepID=UPI00224B492F|nr:hypothetical protein [Brucella intermedia]